MFWNFVMAQAVVCAVIEISGQPLWQAVTRAVAADAVDDLMASTPRLDHIADHLGRVLQVNVDWDDGCPARKIEASRKCGFLAKIA